MHTPLLLLASVMLTILCVPEAWAGVTCQIIPSMCPPPPGGGVGGPSAVPEPGTLALLAAGASAVGAALRRRRNKP